MGVILVRILLLAESTTATSNCLSFVLNLINSEPVHLHAILTATRYRM
jgi:hypothetical protein